MRQKIRIYSQYYVGGNNALSSRINNYIDVLKQEYDLEIICSFDKYPQNIFKRFCRKNYLQDGVIVIELFSGKNTTTGIIHRLLHYIVFSISCFFHIFFSPKPHIIIILSPPIFLPIFSMHAARIRKISYILEVHDLWPESIVQFGILKRKSFIFSVLTYFEKKIYFHAKHIIALTAGVRKGIESMIPNQAYKISLLYFLAQKIEGISDNPYLKLQENIGKRDIYLFAGNMNEAYDFIKAKDFIESKQDLFFVFIGDGSQEKYIQENIADFKNVLMLPRMSKLKVESYLNYCDGIFIPLKNNVFYKGTFPVKGIEAIVNEKKIIFWGPKDGEFSLFLKKLKNREVLKDIFGKQYFEQKLSILVK